ncbi:hypothetical protein [Longirhabdus pacifica]|uniref:hypothetical protein n=1 Tax=Longirhabdus pacifica TaxID=2305227 RepID=UPI001F0B7B48|nr:hypothetical protein [Longirhabdus pacifica]
MVLLLLAVVVVCSAMIVVMTKDNEVDASVPAKLSTATAVNYPYFNAFIAVGEDTEPAQNLSILIQNNAFDIDKNAVDFDALTTYVSQQSKLGIVGTLNHTFESSQKTSDVMDGVTSSILQNLQIPQSDENVALYRSFVADAFIDLKDQLDKGWFTFTPSDNELKTKYTYNTLFIVKKNQFLYAMPSVLTVEVDASKEEVLNLSESDAYDYKVNIKGLKILSF